MPTGTGYSPQCYPPRMTRAEAIARRTAGTLKENCVVVITDAPVIGNTDTSPTEIELNPTSPTELGLTARVFTKWDDSAWHGIYDIDLGVDGSITRLTDNRQNTVVDNDADSPTVHTQFPWGNTQWRDNYAEDTTFTAPQVVAPFTVTNSRFVGTTMDFTGATTGFILDTEVTEGGTHHIQGSFPIWSNSKISGGATVNCNPAAITLNNSEVKAGASVSATVAGTISISDSKVAGFGTIILNQGTLAANSIAVTDSEIRDGAQLQNDLGSRKSLQINRSVVEDGAIIRGQAGTINRNLSISQSTVRGTNTILVRDDAGGTILTSDIQSSPITIDGNTSSAIQWSDCKLVRTTVNHGTAATNCQWTASELIGCIVNALGPGTGTFSITMNSNLLINTEIRTSAGATGELSINQTNADGGTVPFGAIAIDADSPRDLTLDGGNILTGSFSIIQTGTTQTTAGGLKGDRVTNCTLQEGEIFFNSTVGEPSGHSINNCLLIGGPDVPGIPDGRITIDGTSAHVLVFANEVWGQLILTDVPDGALTSPTSVYDNYIGPGSSIEYVGGDSDFKQIRNNRVEGLSHIFCNGLTSAAGGTLADVFACRIANQSVLTVNGARVPGFPVRNAIVENNSSLTVDPGGAVLQFRVAQAATVSTGPFTHLFTEVSGNFVQTLTAANINNLHNKGFNDTV